ncbi:MAG TPA: tetratricopeptide repeat protein [Terriglobia bacterium]|nr:tetratricopeptide repeat protein [Terriglobia bacterium]
MLMRSLLIAALLGAVAAPARDKPESWVEVRSPHFVVVSNAGQKQARRAAYQFERMRAVFGAAFPHVQVDPATPIIVLALKDQKSFETLEPPEWLAKGQMNRTGMFQSGADKNYILMRLDAGGAHPYSVIYHEYTHVLSAGSAEWMPLWLNEGLAEFYQNTEIRDKDALIGQASAENLEVLRTNRLLPLTTLFAVNHASPYYNEDHKASIFYAEAWALTHYLMVDDRKHGTQRLQDYTGLVSKGLDATTAAARAFGDLSQLQETLAAYVRQQVFSYFRLPAATGVDVSDFRVRSLPQAQADALRADFMAHEGREADARPLLEEVLREDPSNVLAHESMGYLAVKEGRPDEARQWFEQAVRLDSRSYLAQYYFAAMSMQGTLDERTAAQVEASLRAAIKLNSAFAPAYDRLAVFYGSRREHLDDAHILELQATELDPGNLAYRINGGNILLEMGRVGDALRVVRTAIPLAKNPRETALAEAFIHSAEQYQEALQARDDLAGPAAPAAEPASGAAQSSAAASPGGDAGPPAAPPLLRRRDETPQGPRHTIAGTIKSVECSGPVTLDLTLEAGGRTVNFHTEDRYKVVFTAANFTPPDRLDPCKAIAGLHALIVYAGASDPTTPGEIVSIELRH